MIEYNRDKKRGGDSVNESILYDGLDKAQIHEVLGCFGAKIKKYEAGETIAQFPSDTLDSRTVGVVIEGTARLSLYDIDGESYLSQVYLGEGVFGSMFLSQSPDDYYVIEAKTSCTVAYTDFERISDFCENLCPIHVHFSRNLYRLIVAQSKADTKRLSIISKKTLRDKLLCYFSLCANDAQSSEFNINITLSDLSKYLCADRSAMMREMKKLKDDGVLDAKGSHIKLL